MNKKAGIIVSASAAALLALTPVAFATDAHEGSFFGGGNNVSAPGTFCNNDATGSVMGGAAKDVTGAAAGAITGVGVSESKSFAADEDARNCSTASEAGDN